MFIRLLLTIRKLSLLGVQHFHEECLMRRIPLHVLEIQKVLSALGHHFEVWQQV